MNIQFTVYVSPLSQNRVYKRSSQGRMFMTDEGKDFKNTIGWEAKQTMNQKNLQMFEGDVSVTFEFYMPSRRGDPSNIEKLILDALEGIVYKNDRQVREHHCYGKIDKEVPRITITVEPL